MSIKLKGSTDGSVTLQAPADTSPTGTDKTFTLPTQDGDAGQILKTDGSGALSFTDNLSSGRNLVINGAMQVAQRGTSDSDLNSYATVDRFRLKRVLTDELAGTQEQSSTAPAGFSNSYKVDITTAESALAADEFFSMRHLIEAQNLQQLDYNTSDAKAVTLSFWIRSHVTGTYAVGLENPDGSRNIAKTYSVSSANTWEHKTITFPGDTGGANPNNDNGIGFQIDWYLAAGSNFTSSDGSSWGAQNNNRRAYGQSANAIGTTGGVYLTGVQLEVGEVATAFERRSYHDELARCRRYYFQSRQLGETYAGCYYGYGISANRIGAAVRLPIEMRANPTFVLIRPVDGVDDGAHRYLGVDGSSTTTDVSFSSVGFADRGRLGFPYLITGSNEVVAGVGYLFHIEAHAEL